MFLLIFLRAVLFVILLCLSSYSLFLLFSCFSFRPWDQQQDIRSEIVLESDKLGLKIERSHHEVAASKYYASLCFLLLFICSLFYYYLFIYLLSFIVVHLLTACYL
jgi:hypothetical protein